MVLPGSNRIALSNTVRKGNRAGRNELCHCGSGRKYKRCCLGRNEAKERNHPSSKMLEELFNFTGRLAQFEKYAARVFSVPRLLSDFTDSRLDPDIPTFDVVNSLFHAALLRIPPSPGRCE